MKYLMIAAAAALVAGGALATGTPSHNGKSSDYLEGGLTYELFERSVHHVDLETCPAQFDPEAVFCRMTLAAEEAHIFVFSYDGDQPLLVVQHHATDENLLRF